MATEYSGLAPRIVMSIAGAAALAWLGGLVLGEYPFTGDGIQWLAILGGAGLGAAVAWVVNRVWSSAPPPWMGPVAGVLATWGEIRAVQEDTPPGASWPSEGWAAVIAAGALAAYGVLAAYRASSSQTS